MTMSTSRNLNQILLTKAGQLPDKLVADITTEQGAFCLKFLHSLSREQFDALKKAAEYKDRDFTLFFYQQEEGSVEPAVAIDNFDAFDLSKVTEVKFNGNTAAFQGRMDDEPIHYVSVTLITK